MRGLGGGRGFRGGCGGSHPGALPGGCGGCAERPVSKGHEDRRPVTPPQQARRTGAVHGCGLVPTSRASPSPGPPLRPTAPPRWAFRQRRRWERAAAAVPWAVWKGRPVRQGRRLREAPGALRLRACTNRDRGAVGRPGGTAARALLLRGSWPDGHSAGGLGLPRSS